MKDKELLPEEWRDVVGYEGLYQVSSYGRVKSLQLGKETIMKHTPDKDGYRSIGLSKNGNPKGYQVHRLVAIAFIENKDNKETVNHVDGNKANNNFDNLEWNTRSENMLHAYKTGLTNSIGENSGRAKLTESDVRCIRLSNCSHSELGKIYGVAGCTITCIKTRRTWRNVQ